MTTGIEKIKIKIFEDAEFLAQEIISSAESKANQMVSTARKDAELDLGRYASEAKVASERVIEQAQSAATLIMRNAQLKERHLQIDKTIFQVLEEMRSLPDKQYFDMILSLIKNSKMQAEGELILSEDDKKRMPADFLQALPLDIKLSTATRNGLHDGFILKYGDIEINGSFESILAEKHEALEDLINKCLF